MIEKEYKSQAQKTLPERWHMVKFGDVVRDVKIDANPENSGLERYVAGGHMQTDDLHIKQWGIIGDGYLGPAFHRKFVKGQVLYGSRRTYLRKVAIAEFDGICANTTFVLESKDGKLLPDLLPFVMQSESFAEHSVKKSKGSVNPYVNWKDIAIYEFPLPPIDEQRRIANILWAAEECIIKNEKLVKETEFYKKILMVELINKGIGQSEFQDTEIGMIPDEWKVVKLGEISKISYGLGQPPSTMEDGVPMVRATNIKSGKIFTDGMLKIDATKIPPRGIFLKSGDIIVVRSGAYTGDIGFVTKEFEGSVAGYDLIVSANREKVDPQFLSNYLLTPKIQKIYFEGLKIRSAQPHLNSDQLMNTLVALPSLTEQRHIVEIISKIDDTIQKSQESVIKTKALKMILINQFLNDGLSPTFLDKPQSKRVIYETQVGE